MSQCPYFDRAKTRGRYPIAGYCLGYRDGRLRIPTVGEFTRYCTTVLHGECNVFRVRLAQEAERAEAPRAAA